MAHNYGFYRPETEKIVEKHANDFNILTETAYLKAHGGHEKYVKSLGGVFTRMYGKTITNPTEEQWQDCCDYVWGLASIWGIDYDNGGTHWKWGDGTSDRYYTDSTAVKKRYYNGWDIDEFLTKGNGRPLNTNCNYWAQVILGKVGIRKSTTRAGDTYLKSVGGKKILSKKDLRPGDLVHFFDTKDKWHHVTVVGRIASDKVYCYDTGSRWIRNRKREFEFTVDKNNKTTRAFGYGGKWIGVHYFDLSIFPDKSDKDLAWDVIRDKYGSGDKRKAALGSRYAAVQKVVDGMYKNHTEYIRILTDEVFRRKHGSGNDRKKSLGEYYDEVQKKVTWTEHTAQDVITGKYGGGTVRRKALGDNYWIVQGRVNQLLGKG